MHLMVNFCIQCVIWRWNKMNMWEFRGKSQHEYGKTWHFPTCGCFLRLLLLLLLLSRTKRKRYWENFITNSIVFKLNFDWRFFFSFLFVQLECASSLLLGKYYFPHNWSSIHAQRNRLELIALIFLFFVEDNAHLLYSPDPRE